MKKSDEASEVSDAAEFKTYRIQAPSPNAKHFCVDPNDMSEENEQCRKDFETDKNLFKVVPHSLGVEVYGINEDHALYNKEHPERGIQEGDVI